MIPRFCHIKIGCKCNGQIVKWNAYLMIPRFCLVKIRCKWTREIIKWKSKMLQKITTSLLHSKNCARCNKRPDIAMSVSVVRYLNQTNMLCPEMRPKWEANTQDNIKQLTCLWSPYSV